MRHKEHKKQTVSGLKWNILNQIISQFVTFGIGILLMRLLNPSDFGLLGMVTIFSGFIQVFNNFGLGTSLIQKKIIKEIDKNSIFYFNIVLGLLLTLTLYLSSNYIAIFFSESKLGSIAKTISIIFTVQSLNVVQNSLLRKEMFFKKIFYN